MEQWYYQSNEGSVLGPFSSEEMRAWFVQGYLPNTLMIAQNPNSGFNPLRDWFPNLDKAFQPGAAGQPGRNGRLGANQNGAAAAAPAPEEDDLRWYFLDRNRQVQGPFSPEQMRQWFVDGYFEPTLQIYDAARPEDQWGWKPLKDYFPNTQQAFLGANGGAAVGGSGQNVNVGGSYNGGGMDLGSRFQFPEWLPTPPPYRGVKKVYPSEKRQAVA